MRENSAVFASGGALSPPPPPGGGTASIFFTEDALDPDNFACLIALCDTVRDLIDKKERDVVLYIDVSTAVADFSIPRFRLGAENKMVIPAMEHVVDVGDLNVQGDTRILQIHQMLLFRYVLSTSGGLSPYVESGKCKVVFIQGEQTRQGVWEGIVPRAYLFYDAQARRMRTTEEVDAFAGELEEKAWHGDSGSFEDGNFGASWTGYIPNDKEKHRLSPKDARASGVIRTAMDRLRASIRAHIIGEVVEMRTDESNESLVHNAFTPRSFVMDRLSQGTLEDDVYFVVCAPCACSHVAYQAVKGSPGGLDRIKGVYIQMLTLDKSDNITGRQLNERLAPRAADTFLKSIRDDGVYVFAAPTQVCKPGLQHYSNADVETAGLSADLIGTYSGAVKMNYSWIANGFCLAMYHKAWMETTKCQAAIFDPLCAWALYHDAVNGNLRAKMDLLPVLLTDELEIITARGGLDNTSKIFIPNLFKGQHLSVSGGLAVLTSPFTGQAAVKEWMDCLQRWYSVYCGYADKSDDFLDPR